MVVTKWEEEKGTKAEKFRIPEELPILPQNEARPQKSAVGGEGPFYPFQGAWLSSPLCCAG